MKLGGRKDPGTRQLVEHREEPRKRLRGRMKTMCAWHLETKSSLTREWSGVLDAS